MADLTTEHVSDLRKRGLHNYADRYLAGERCHCPRGEFHCDYLECPQTKDGEPMLTHRHCPLDPPADDSYWGD